MQNLLTFKAFTKWLDGKPKDETYDFRACRGCAIAQYVREVGVKNLFGASSTGWYDTEGPRHHVLIPDHSILSDWPQTFGAAAERAKAYRLDTHTPNG